MNMQNDPARIRAKRVLRHYLHYFWLCAKGNSGAWTRDNDVEIDNMVDDLITAAVNSVINNHVEQVK
jgi:hypothetical protein